MKELIDDRAKVETWAYEGDIQCLTQHRGIRVCRWSSKNEQFQGFARSCGRKY